MAKIKKYAEPGSGQGTGKEKVGDGGRDKCYCSECKKTFPHDKGTPCVDQVCPDCGGKLEPAKEYAESPICLPKDHPKVNDKKDHYPIKDADQAKNALTRVADYSESPSWFDGTLTELKNIARTAVKESFPDIKMTMNEFMSFAEIQTFNDLRRLLETAVNEKYATKENEYPGVYIADTLIGERGIIIDINGEYFQLNYDLDANGNIILGEEVPAAQQWITEYAEEIETIDIPDVDLFVGGTPRTMEFTEDDIARIVSNSHELAKEIKPPVFLGHTRRLGWPAQGIVKNLKQDGMKIIGDLKKVPMKIAKYINSGGYFRGSAEIQPTYHSEAGKDYKDVFYGFGILGQDVPVLKLMRDLPIPVYSEGPETQVYQFAVTAKTITTHGGDSTMPDKKEVIEVGPARYAELIESERKLAGLEDQQAKVTEYSETITARDSKIEKLETEAKEYSEKIDGMEKKYTSSKIADSIDKLKARGAMDAVEAEEVKAFAEDLNDSDTKKYSEEFEGTQLDKYLAGFEKRKDNTSVDYSEKSHKDKTPKVEETEDDSGLDAKITKYAEDHEMTYAEAISFVSVEEDETAFQSRIR